MRNIIIGGLLFFVGIFVFATNSLAYTVTFDASPSNCSYPCNTTVTWSVSGPGSGSSVQILRNNSSVSELPGNQSLSGSHSVVLISGTNTFDLYSDANVKIATKVVVADTTPANTPTPAAPTPTPQIAGCNQSCGNGISCGPNLICSSTYGNVCRYPGTYESRGDCSTTGGNTSGASGPTATPAPSNSSSSTSTSTSTTTSSTASNTSGSTGGTSNTTTSPTPETSVLGTQSAQIATPSPVPTGEVKAAQSKNAGSMTRNILYGVVAAGIVISGIIAFKMSSVSSASKLKKTIEEMKKEN